MEGFHYVDIFSTKGIEYIIVLGFLLVLIYFWRRLNRPRMVTASETDNATTTISLVDWFSLADNYHYHQGHAWAMPNKDMRVKVGVDDFVQKLVGKVDEIRLPDRGTMVRQGEQGFAFEIDGKIIPVLAPVEGEVVGINEAVLKDPKQLLEDPFGAGWLFEVQSKNWHRDKNHLFSGELAKAWLRQHVDRISDLMTSRMGIVMQDGGAIAPGFARELDPDHWDNLTREFLLTN